MIPQPQKWRKVVSLSLQAGELKELDELATLDGRIWGRKNRSNTVVNLVKQELKRRKKEAEAAKG